MLGEIWRRIVNLFRRGKFDRELDEEMDLHRELRERELRQSAESKGEGAVDDARFAARQRFGNELRLREESREMWGWKWAEDLLQDLRFGIRMLAKNKSFAAIAILTIGLGIGASTTVFSWISTVLLNPLPGASHPERVVALEEIAPDGDSKRPSYLDFRDFRDNLRQIESMTVAREMAFAVGSETNIERIWGELVSGNYFDVLGVQPAAGRFFSIAERDDSPDAHPVVVISHAFWASRYHSDRSAIGAILHINRHPFTIIGVAPENFHGSMPGESFDIWAPATMLGQVNSGSDWMLEDRKTRMFRVLARLAPAVSIEQARSEVQALARRMAVADADTNEGMSATLLPMWKGHDGIQSPLLAPLSLLMAVCGALLLIVCANVANLLLARATSRQKEFSVRLALGARRSRIVRQVFTEMMLLAIGGAALGMVIASWLSDSLRWLVPSSGIPTLVHPPIDVRVLLFTAALAFGVAILAGITPALQVGRENVNEMLKDRTRGGTSSAGSHRLRGLLVISEISLAVITIVGAGLFAKSFYLASAIQPGFDADKVAIAHVSLSSAGYNLQQADSFSGRLQEQLQREPGVTAVGYSDFVPLSIGGDSWEDLEIQGYVPGPSESMKIYRTVVAPGYFDLMKIPLLEGRDFNLQDDKSHDPMQPVMIVNQEFVRRFVPTGAAIGRKVRGWGSWFTIVGVVRDIKYFHITESPIPYFYVPARQIYRPEDGGTFYVRTRGSVEQAIVALRREAQAIDPAVPVFNTISLKESIAGSLFGQKIAATLLSVLAGSALLLATIGVYGVMAYSVAQRTNEIGIRMALGARPADIVRMVARDGLVFALAGLAVGFIVAIGLTRLVAAMLVHVSPSDPTIYACVGVFTILMALAATAIPARRAMRVDPMVALRFE
jgi:predicted permease